MSFSNPGSGIINADDVFISSLSQGNILRYNTGTAKWNNVAVSVTTSEIADDTVTEPKLAVSNAPGTGQVLTWDGTALAWAAAINTVTSVAGKTGAVTLVKADVGLANVDNTSDANKPVSTATQTALNAKADKTITITGATSLSGGGSLSANRTLSLVGDAATPGNSMYYGTNGTGTKGFYALPAGNPTMGGDLTGTASNAQLAAGAVGTTEVADSSITEPKLSVTNTPATGQVLSWNGANMAWAGALAFAFTKVTVTSVTYTVPSSFTYVFADATSTGITITLPAPANNAYVRVKRMNSGANGVQVVAPAGSFIDSGSVGSDVLNNQFDSQEYWSDGTNWYR